MSARVARLFGPGLAVAVAAAAIGWLPARNAEQAAHVRTDVAERLVSDLEVEVGELSVLSAEQVELAARLAELRTQIPDDHYLADVVLTLQSMADQAGMELVDVVPATVFGPFDDPRTPMGTSSIVIAVAMRGGFSSLVTLLGLLDDQPRLLMVDAVAVGIDETSMGLVVDLELRVFTTRELVAAGNDDDDLDDNPDDNGFGGDGGEPFSNEETP